MYDPMFKAKRLPFLILLSFLPALEATARTFYVDARQGSDANDGLSRTASFQRIQQAAKAVQAGDEVLIRPGVYFGPVELHAKGTGKSPIVFRAEKIGENDVVVTNADPKIRGAEIKWNLEDEALGLYSVPYTGGWPARMLYGGADLFPYRDVERLKTFTADNDNPGPNHGYTFDPSAKKLYVRLHAQKKYGPTDPNQQRMAVAPATGTHYDGTFVTKPEQYCFGVLGEGDAHIVLDGLTFETPGVAGVYVEANHVTVRRCWFRGCRTGVAGNYVNLPPEEPLTADALIGAEHHLSRFDPDRQRRSAADIVVEYCDYTQYPSYEDSAELIAQGLASDAVFIRKGAGKSEGGNLGLPSNHFKYEIGMTARMARNWVIRRNYVHNVFDGLSCHAVSASQNLRVEENIFENVIDNGVETEDHAQNMHITRNLFLNNFMPLSYQPLCGPPWPGPIFITQNIVMNTPENGPIVQKKGGVIVFKIHAFNLKNFGREKTDPIVVKNKDVQQRVPDPGFIVANNTILFPEGRLGMPPENKMPNQLYVNNVFATDAPDKGISSSQFKNNAVAPATRGQPGAGDTAAGNGGIVLPDVTALGLDKELRPRAGSPLQGKAVPVPEAGLKLRDLGAVQTGDTWYPLQVGPHAAK